MASITKHFTTEIYREALADDAGADRADELALTIRSLMVDDEAGQRWCEEHNYPGYTSYASVNDLVWRYPVFAKLAEDLGSHAHRFADHIGFDLGGAPLELDSIWANVVVGGGVHSGHIHPHSVLSGTYYVTVPEGAGALRFEDPRLAMMMGRPPLTAEAAQANGSFVTVVPKPGMVLLWESWLRHEVLAGEADEERISISFNFQWGAS